MQLREDTREEEEDPLRPDTMEWHILLCFDLMNSDWPNWKIPKTSKDQRNEKNRKNRKKFIQNHSKCNFVFENGPFVRTGLLNNLAEV